jgi:hypothetical protein
MKVFVFGSNLAGRHGRGAAAHAQTRFGAIYGRGEGLQGQSYALPTKDHRLRTLPLDEIKKHAETFKSFARANPDMTFQLTPVGTGLAGLKAADVAPLFADCPPNVELPEAFRVHL